MSARPSIRARDSSGKQVSLLNDEETASHHQYQLQHRPSQPLSYRSNSSSSSSTSMTRANSDTPSNGSSPSTPGLLRADSYDSQNTNGPISPLTPSSAEEAAAAAASRHSHPHPTHPNAPPFKAARYDFFPRMATYDEYPSHHQYAAYSEARTASFAEPHGYAAEGETYGSSNAATGAERAGKRYPCRFRESHGCEKTFTTSGHASRHSKIHTAEKAVHCSHPGCQKKFTRADNMKQHLETHSKEKNRTSFSPSTTLPASASRSPGTSSKLTLPSGIKKTQHPPGRTSRTGSRTAPARPDLPPLDPALYNACGPALSSAASSPATTPFGTFSDAGGYSPMMSARPLSGGDGGLGLLALAADYQAHK